MKLTHLTTLVLVASLAACSSTKSPQTNSDEPIRNQQLSTNFTEDGVKVITDCKWYKPWQDECNIVAIEATATTWTNGNSTPVVNEARKVARAEAYSNVSHFIRNQITSTRVTQTIAKHVEKAKDEFNRTGSEDSEMTDKEAKNTSTSARENSNDTARTVTRTIREHSESVLRGFKVIKEEKVGPQEISVTIRWDKESDRAARQLRKQFSN